MNGGSLAADAVSIRRLRATGVSESAVRRQLAAVPIPATRRLVFVRRIILRGRHDQVGSAMGMALTQLAEHDRSEAIAFADFPALVVACARAAMTGGLGAGPGGGWHWRVLGLSQTASPGEAVATLLTAHPIEAAAATAALAANGLLGPVWRDLSEPAAARLTVALGEAAGFSPLGWPEDDGETSANIGWAGEHEAVLARARAFWSPVLGPLPPRHEAVRTAATLSLLRWSPMSLEARAGALWRILLARIADGGPPTRIAASDSATTPTRVGPAAAAAANGASLALAPQPTAMTARLAGVASFESVQTDSRAPPQEFLPASAPIPVPPIPGAPLLDAAAPIETQQHGEVISTRWGGVLFLVNALNRLDIAPRLEDLGAMAPSGWRVLLDVGVVLGMPEDDPLAEFLAAQDCATPPPSDLCEQIASDMEALYAQQDVWPPRLMQPARLMANETHLDLDLLTPRVDIDIRRVGLDIDPGWVPWLGRIITFHYPNLAAVHFSEA